MFVENLRCREIAKVSLGTYHGLGTDMHGRPYAWGLPRYGVLGSAAFADQVEPEALPSRLYMDLNTTA